MDIIKSCVEGLKTGKIPAWRVEDEMIKNYDVAPPENFRLAAICRQRFIEELAGERFKYIQIPERPYKIRYRCEKDGLIWELDARDEHHICSLCQSRLEPMNEYAPLVANYVGGVDDYYSFAGRIRVKGSVEKQFVNLLVYGTGLGPIGVTRGCYLINRFGGAQIKVEDSGRALRCLGYLFKTKELCKKAIDMITTYLPQLRFEMNRRLTEFNGRVSSVEFVSGRIDRGFVLYLNFTAQFKDFRGHGDISNAVGFAKVKIDDYLREKGVRFDFSIIAQGFDGDLKPSPENRRGRYVSAQVLIPVEDFEQSFELRVERFLSTVAVDKLGAKKLGCQFYSGMGGEIIPAIYKATKVNPHGPLVSSFENIYARIEDGNLIYGVELPNIEVGIVSNREGLIPPVGREALRIMGVATAKEFAASVAAQVLAGEFNLALEIARERLYRPK
ncbi:MAG TPA: hypothetical protein EYP58_01355 [bacterium (Candidatus Stahlbacteria)]|nr:hypothetical protein [Candidatus Stahlbacteria bacterium]